jgi:hypothetical protein
MRVDSSHVLIITLYQTRQPIKSKGGYMYHGYHRYSNSERVRVPAVTISERKLSSQMHYPLPVLYNILSRMVDMRQ